VETYDHEWTGWQWKPGTAIYPGGLAKQCLRCRTWLYDIITNAASPTDSD
jgi:hypothetical protein